VIDENKAQELVREMGAFIELKQRETNEAFARMSGMMSRLLDVFEGEMPEPDAPPFETPPPEVGPAVRASQTGLETDGITLDIDEALAITRISGGVVGSNIGARINTGNPITRWILPTGGDDIFFQMETTDNRLYHVFMRDKKLRRYQLFLLNERPWPDDLHVFSPDLWHHWGDTQPKNQGKWELRFPV
jgi:hypothetical protein